MGLVEDGNGGLGNENGNGNVDVGMMGVDDLDGMGDDVGTFGNLDWLNELDWSRGPWMNLDSLT